MTNFSDRLIVAAILALSIPGVCHAQAPDLTQQGAPPSSNALPAPLVVQVNLPGQTIYDGEADSAGLVLSSWGAGAAKQDDAHGLTAGKSSVRIESQGFFEGGTIGFSQPVDLGDVSDTSKYLQLSLSLTADPKYPAPAPPADNQNNGFQRMPPGMGGMQRYRTQNFTGDSRSLFKLAQMPQQYQQMPPMGGQNQQRGGRGQQGYGTNPNGAQTEDDTALPAQPATAIHVVLTFADGTQTDVSRDVPIVQDAADWFTIGFPLSKLGLTAGAAPKLISLSIATDSPCLISVGRIKLVTDNTPITASTGGDKDVSVNEKMVFQTNTSAGASTLSYQWDFDTTGSFIAQADGSRVTHSYDKSGTYKVTLVVTDVDGIKSPVTTSSIVHVEE